MNYLKEKYNAKNFKIVHDLLPVNKKFLEALSNINKNINWTFSTRADYIDEKILTKIKQTGCNRIFLGIETFSNTIQAEIKKTTI